MTLISRFGLIAVVFFTSMLHSSVAQSQARQIPLPAIYFDLGDVLIYTKDPAGFRYTIGAELYLLALIQRGYNLRLITNIPETWGRNHEEKYEALKAYVAKNWREPSPFPWHIFDLVLLPPNDQLRKPHPYLFIEAMKAAGPCQPVYQGEDVEEVKVAKDLGFLAYLVSATLTHGRPAFAPLEQLYCRPYNPQMAFRRFMFSKRGF